MSKKPRRVRRPQAANKVEIIFCRGVYLTENTYQAASVRVVRRRRTRSARSRLQSFCQKRAQPFFDSLKGGFVLHSPHFLYLDNFIMYPPILPNSGSSHLDLTFV